jgi:hypothetical protein
MLKKIANVFGAIERMRSFPRDELSETESLVILPDTRRIIPTKQGLKEVVERGAIVKKGGRG